MNAIRPRARLLVCATLLAAVTPPPLAAHEEIEAQIKLLDQRLARSPDDALLYLRRADLHRRHRDWEPAAADYNRALELDPDLSAAQLGQVQLGLDQNAFGRAAQLARHFVESHPGSAAGHAALAEALAGAGEHGAAASSQARAVELMAPPTPDAFLRLAELRLAADPNNTTGAIAALDLGNAKLGDNVALHQRALEISRDHGDTDEALARCRTLSRLTNGDPRWSVAEGDLEAGRGEAEAARRAYTSALERIESLPARRRQTAAVRELELEIRGRLASANAVDR